MGFSDYFIQTVSTPTTIPQADAAKSTNSTSKFGLDDEKESPLIPDQEILDSTDEIYFSENVDTGVYELTVIWLT